MLGGGDETGNHYLVRCSLYWCPFWGSVLAWGRVVVMKVGTKPAFRAWSRDARTSTATIIRLLEDAAQKRPSQIYSR